MDLIVGSRGDADAAGFRDALKPRGNVNAVSKDVVGLDDYVADIDAHTECNAPLFHLTDSKFFNAGLELHSSSDRFDRAWKLCQEPIAGIFHDAAAVFRNRRLDTARKERGQFGMRSLFVAMHKSRIASHVGGQYRRQPALDPDWPLLHHGPQSNPKVIVRRIRRQRQTRFDGMPTQADVDYWHQTDMPKQHRNVRYRDVVDLAARNADVLELRVI